MSKLIVLDLFFVLHRGRRARDRIVEGFTITDAISDYHDRSCEFPLMLGVHDTSLCDKVCQ